MDNEETGEQGERREEAIDDEEDGGEGVDANVEVSKTLENFEALTSKECVVL